MEIAENIFLKKFMMEISAKQQKVLKMRLMITNNGEKEAKTVEKSRFVELSDDDKIYIIKQIKKPKLCITL